MTNEFSFETNSDTRALFGARRAEVSDCTFDGAEALMQCTELTAKDAIFSAPRPLWHLSDGVLHSVTFLSGADSALCRGNGITLMACSIGAPFVLADAENIVLDASVVTAPDFAARCRKITLTDTVMTGDNALADATDITASNLDLSGNRSFARVKGGVIDFSTLAGNDLLQNAENITISDTVIDGERLGWYSNGLTLTHCMITGARPFFHAKNLTLIDCVLDPSCVDAFELCEVNATLRGTAPTIKNPIHGSIHADAYNEIVFDDTAAPGTDCKID